MFPHLSAIKESKEPSYVSTCPQRKLTTQRSVKWSQNAFAQFLLKRVTFPRTVADQSKDLVAFFLENYCIWNNMLSVFSLYLLLPDHFSAFETMCSLAKSGFSLYLLLPDQSCDQCCDFVSRINHCLEMFFAVSKNSCLVIDFHWCKKVQKYTLVVWNWPMLAGCELDSLLPPLGNSTTFSIGGKIGNCCRIKSPPNIKR